MNSLDELTVLHQNTINHPGTQLLFFKHSKSCGTSRMAMKQFDELYTGSVPVYLVHVRESRAVSDKISELYQITHESPQVLLIRDGKCIYHESHYRIDPGSISEYENLK